MNKKIFVIILLFITSKAIIYAQSKNDSMRLLNEKVLDKKQDSIATTSSQFNVNIKFNNLFRYNAGVMYKPFERFSFELGINPGSLFHFKEAINYHFSLFRKKRNFMIGFSAIQTLLTICTCAPRYNNMFIFNITGGYMTSLSKRFSLMINAGYTVRNKYYHISGNMWYVNFGTGIEWMYLDIGFGVNI